MKDQREPAQLEAKCRALDMIDAMAAIQPFFMAEDVGKARVWVCRRVMV